MLDIKLIRESPDVVISNLEKRKDKEKVKWIKIIKEKDEKWKKLHVEVDELRHERNDISRKIGQLKKEGKSVKDAMMRASSIPEEIEKKEAEKDKIRQEIDKYLLEIPNIMHESVPVGKNDEENVEIRKWGEPKKFDFELKSHVEAGEKLGVLDFDRSAKLAGHGFYMLKGQLALLNRALINFAIDFMISKGYTYVEPPLMIKKEVYSRVVSFSDFENVMYKIDGDDSYLIATAEHPMNAQFVDEVIDEEKLPIKFAGYSMCFRREVGSVGIDTKGLFRTHQFNKVEQVIICKPEDSWTLHEELQQNCEQILQALKLPYRVVNVCTGDLGNFAAKKYDTEVWMPRQNKYRETMSNSNYTDYQTRRSNIKIGKQGSGNYRYPHSLNNTALATSRILVAILENYQQKDGSIKVPDVLQKYMNSVKVIKG